MSSKSNPFLFLKSKGKGNGLNKHSLLIDCSTCLENEINNNCFNCILNYLYTNKNKDLNTIFIEKSVNQIPIYKVKKIQEYIGKLKIINKYLKKIEAYIEEKCIYKDFKCELSSVMKNFLTTFKNKEFNPIIIYNLVNNQLSKLNLIKNTNYECQKCFMTLNSFIEAMLQILNNTSLLHDYKTSKIQNQDDFYHFYFFDNVYLPEHIKKTQIQFTNDDLIEEYKIGEYESYHVFIYSVQNEFEKKYVTRISSKSESEREYYLKIVNEASTKIKITEVSRILPLHKIIKIYEKKALNYLQSKFKLSSDEFNRLAFNIALKMLNLEKIFPLLIDDNVEEIFLDFPSDQIYINHQRHGRCRTAINFTVNELNRLKTFLRIYSGKRLDFSNPSIKVVIKNNYFYCRFALDVGPVQVHNFALDIRKLNKNIFNIQDLLKNGTLNVDIASFLYFLIIRRVNVTVTGETDTGKTTLINTLDLLAPKEFRKIYVENVIESLDQIKFERHQLKYQVDSNSKQNQIKNLLHRTPDIIYLGEILTKEEANALFHCLAAGLKGFQTIHSNDIQSLINRCIFHFNIDISCLNDLGIIVCMKKSKSGRKIDSLYEIDSFSNDIREIAKVIYKFKPETKNWELKVNLFDTNTIVKIRRYDFFTALEFESYLNLYNDVFMTLKKTKKMNNYDLIKLFDQLTYFSRENLEDLSIFWDGWKKTSSLN